MTRFTTLATGPRIAFRDAASPGWASGLPHVDPNG
jgi:hypothetical protein